MKQAYTPLPWKIFVQHAEVWLGQERANNPASCCFSSKSHILSEIKKVITLVESAGFNMAPNKKLAKLMVIKCLLVYCHLLVNHHCTPCFLSLRLQFSRPSWENCTNLLLCLKNSCQHLHSPLCDLNKKHTESKPTYSTQVQHKHI